MDEERWINIAPGYTFVTTLNGDDFHIRQSGPTKIMFALCGQGWMQTEEWADYPAKAMKVSELCPECLRDFLLRTQP